VKNKRGCRTKKWFILAAGLAVIGLILAAVVIKKPATPLPSEPPPLSWTDALVRNLKLNLLVIKSIEVISPRQIEVSLANGPLVIFNSRQDQKRQLDSLQFILARSKMESKQIAKIDLRFDKPVIVYD